MVTAQQIRIVDEHIGTDVVPREPEPLTFESTKQKILSLCNLVATHYPSSRVIVIIQRPSDPEAIEIEEAMPLPGLKKDDELDAPAVGEYLRS